MGEHSARRERLRGIFSDLIAAYGRKDFESFARHVHEQAVFEWPYLPLKTFPDRMTGRDDFIAASAAGMIDCNGYNHQIDAFHDQLDPDHMIVEYHSQTVLISSGTPYANKYLGILRFEGDVVVYWKEYVNPLPIVEAFGLDFKNTAVSA